MQKTGIFVLMIVLVAAMFCGCRRQPDTTNATTVPATTHSTGKATVPSTAGNTKPSTGVIPDGTTMLPQPTDGTDMGRGRMIPRY